MVRTLVPVISVNSDKCVNCHKCISVCPVKVCIDGSGDVVEINHDLCIGCGNCISACNHGARGPIDDFQEFLESLRAGEKIYAIAAPAIAAAFPGEYKRLFGWLQFLGVGSIFDVSFGAELTVRSYLNAIDKLNPDMVVAQPCPAIVSYAEIHKPELIPYLAPADSPMLHTIKMVKRHYPKLDNARILVLSPCLAKKREFQATGLGDFNVTYASLQEYMEERNIDLADFPEEDFQNPPAERAVLFSSPGGLMKTVERERPDLASRTRKVEGPDIVYDYLNKLPEMVEKGINPILVDCLNCEKGCNGGPGTGLQDKSIEEIEYHISNRRDEAVRTFSSRSDNPGKRRKKIHKVLDQFWEEGLFDRSYVDRSDTYDLVRPTRIELEEIYQAMHKNKSSDFLDCTSCGYGTCEKMAEAIHNGLNKPANCHHFREKIIATVTGEYEKIYLKIDEMDVLFQDVRDAAGNIVSGIQEQSAAIIESTAAVEQMAVGIQNVSRISSEKSDYIENMTASARSSETDISETMQSIQGIEQQVFGINEMIELINGVASRTSLLSFNASIEAAHAGDAGKGFAVVAGEIKRLADATSNNAKGVAELIERITQGVHKTSTTSTQAGDSFSKLINGFLDLAEGMKVIIDQVDELSTGTAGTSEAIISLREQNSVVDDSATTIKRAIDDLDNRLRNLSNISKDSMKTINRLTGEIIAPEQQYVDTTVRYTSLEKLVG